MDFRNFVRGFLGLRPPIHDNFDDDYEKCPRCQSPEETFEENMDSVNIFYHDGDRCFFNIVPPSDPFSSFQQMEEAFNYFFSSHSGRMLDFPSWEEPFDYGIHRDNLLNPSDRNIEISSWDDPEGGPEFPSIDSFLQPKSPRDRMLKPSFRDNRNSVGPTLPLDSDVDNAVLNDKNAHGILKEFSQQPKMDTNWSFRKSVSIRTVRGPDGTVEEHRTIKDSSGREVTTAHKSIGDQSYTVTLHKDNEGLKEKKEELVNLDEKDIPQFEEKWHHIKGGNTLHIKRNGLFQEPNSSIQCAPGDSQCPFIFDKLFRFKCFD